MPYTVKPGTILGLLFSLILPVTEAPAGGYRITDLGRGIIPAAIDRNGDVTGTVLSPFSNPEAFSRRNGVLTRLGLLGGTGKNKGIHGISLDNRGEATVVRSDCSSSLYAELSLYSLLPLPGSSWVTWGAAAINDKAQVPGSCQDRKRAPIFGMARCSGNVRFVPAAINNAGTIVGCVVDTSLPASKSKPRPKWMSAKFDGADRLIAPCVPATITDGKVKALVEQLAAEGNDWMLEGVLDLNDNGEIIGYGTKNGQALHGFILSP